MLELHRQPGLVEKLCDDRLKSRNPTLYAKDSGFGTTLFQLLVPLDFKAAARQANNLLLLPDPTSLVPLPWAHVFFSERTLLNVCARVYDLPEFKPRWWDLDEHGRKKPNKWRQLVQLPDLNRLTIAQFERLCQHTGLQIARRELYGFGGSRLGRLTRGLTRLPSADIPVISGNALDEGTLFAQKALNSSADFETWVHRPTVLAGQRWWCPVTDGALVLGDVIQRVQGQPGIEQGAPVREASVRCQQLGLPVVQLA